MFVADFPQRYDGNSIQFEQLHREQPSRQDPPNQKDRWTFWEHLCIEFRFVDLHPMAPIDH
ncbi:hypothetical protein M3Y98_00066300 [Aphelenchoides besseyi]|nr:hypothetical protein M3Y98_00066300 [Aphelenchoides besseyi]KAI6198803.1 hypothetical protein M3Y96_00558100 [Aphelenchoides besseyi]